MGTKKLDVEISETLYNRFRESVTEPGGIWRGNYKKETAYSAFQSAVEEALKEFLDSRLKKLNDK